MSKQYPECPLYNHNNCKQFHNPKVCAIVRDDNNCLREPPKNRKKQIKAQAVNVGFIDVLKVVLSPTTL